jgi:hypothetical protein
MIIIVNDFLAIHKVFKKEETDDDLLTLKKDLT